MPGVLLCCNTLHFIPLRHIRQDAHRCRVFLVAAPIAGVRFRVSNGVCRYPSYITEERPRTGRSLHALRFLKGIRERAWISRPVMCSPLGWQSACRDGSQDNIPKTDIYPQSTLMVIPNAGNSDGTSWQSAAGHSNVRTTKNFGLMHRNAPLVHADFIHRYRP